MEQATISRPNEAADEYVREDSRQRQAVATLLPALDDELVDTREHLLDRPRQPRDETSHLHSHSSTTRALDPETPLVDEPSWPMNAENEVEFSLLANRLRGFSPSDLPDRFTSLANNMIIPALTGVAERMKALGFECSIESSVDAPIPPTGQAVYFTFDTRYAAGENSLCIRLTPGESVIRVETPGAGSVIMQRIPLPEFAGDNVQRVAIDFLKRVLQ